MSTSAPEKGTGSRTLADLVGLAAAKHADAVAVRHKQDGAWKEVTFSELGEICSEIGRGLIDLGIAPGDRVGLLCTTRPEWSYVDLAISAAGGVVVPIYPTNSPEECEWVLGNSEAVAVVCEDAAQLAKVAAVRERLPGLEHVIAIEAAEGAVSVDELRTRGRAVDPAQLAARTDAVRPEDPYTIIYTSGTTGPPKGCVLTHGNYRAVVDACEAVGRLDGEDEVVYLFLPLAHAFALLIQLMAFDLGTTLAFWGGEPQAIIGELSEVKPTYLPSVPRIFEKIYTLVSAHGDQQQIAGAVQVGLEVRRRQAAGEPVPAEMQAGFDAAHEALYKNVQAAFGGRLREAVTGAAPIAPDILRFFHACGVPVFEGYGMTETSTVITTSRPEAFKIGTVGRALPGVDVRLGEDGEILVKGPNIFREYWGNPEATSSTVTDGWLHTGDLGSIDEDGYVSITGRKKDIIITAGGKNLTPANLENDLKTCRWVSQAVMYGDRRPYPVMLVTLDEEEVVPWAQAEGFADTSVAALATDPRVRALVQEALDAANLKYAQAEQVKRFFILDHDLSQATGELTPTLKVKRNVVNEKYASSFDDLYGAG